MEKVQLAYSWDLDGVVIGNGELAPILSVAKSRFVHNEPPRYTSKNLPDISRNIDSRGFIGLFDWLSHKFHATRTIIPEVTPIFQKAHKTGIDSYANTGRSNRKPWVDMTCSTLKNGALEHYLNELYFTPEGMRTAVSKAVAIKGLIDRGYEAVEHFEDDPRTAVFIASVFGNDNVCVNLIMYKTTGLLYSLDEIDKYPNIKRVYQYSDLY